MGIEALVLQSCSEREGERHALYIQSSLRQMLQKTRLQMRGTLGHYQWDPWPCTRTCGGRLESVRIIFCPF